MIIKIIETFQMNTTSNMVNAEKIITISGLKKKIYSWLAITHVTIFFFHLLYKFHICINKTYCISF